MCVCVFLCVYVCVYILFQILTYNLEDGNECMDLVTFATLLTCWQSATVVSLPTGSNYIYIYILFFSSCVHFASMRCIVVKEVASFPGARSINGRGA